jgi:hypothetical protein
MSTLGRIPEMLLSETYLEVATLRKSIRVCATKSRPFQYQDYIVSDGGMTHERISKESAVAYSCYYQGICLERPTKTTNQLLGSSRKMDINSRYRKDGD